MLAKTLSAAITGLNVTTVEVEVNYSQYEGEPTNSVTTIVGLPDAAIRESRERIWTALGQARVFIPAGKTTINLAPADLRKSGTAFDLPIALCLLKIRKIIPSTAPLEKTAIIGELALDGTIRPIQGALSIAMHARDNGIKDIIVPEENAREAAMAEGIRVFGLHKLEQAAHFFSEGNQPRPEQPNIQALYDANTLDVPDFADVKGQESAKRAITVAAAGNHNLLMIGNPGCGKTMLARRIPGILPKLTIEEALEVTKIHSVAGVLDLKKGLIVNRPFRSPHHTISDGGLVGGSMNPRPGELSLAHNGVLFLDELPEFKRNTLEVLRQPLEQGEVTIARASGTYSFPAKVMLVTAMNPCPCGYYGSKIRRCSCTHQQIASYRGRISGPLVDRIDIQIEVAPISHEQLIRKRDGESSEQMRQKVNAAREAQRLRFRGTNCRCNADMTGQLMDQACQLSTECQDMIRLVIDTLKLSARSYDRILKVARTLADLEQQPNIMPKHIHEASTYRFLDRMEW